MNWGFYLQSDDCFAAGLFMSELNSNPPPEAESVTIIQLREAIAQDSSSRRATETALRASENLFRSVWENSVDGMRLTDEVGNIVAVNGAFCKLVGLPAAQLEGQTFTVIYSVEADKPTMLQNHRRHFTEASLQHRRERNYPLHDGREVRLEITDSFVVSSGKPRLLLSLFRDITAHKKLEDQLRQSQKMEAIG